MCLIILSCQKFARQPQLPQLNTLHPTPPELNSALLQQLCFWVATAVHSKSSYVHYMRDNIYRRRFWSQEVRIITFVPVNTALCVLAAKRRKKERMILSSCLTVDEKSLSSTNLLFYYIQQTTWQWYIDMYINTIACLFTFQGLTALQPR